MNSLTAKNLGRRFNQDWIFREFNFEFLPDYYALLGHNGSGKSTLLQLLSGQLTPSEGAVSLKINGIQVQIEDFYRQIAWVAPYTELPEELTLDEFWKFHFGIRKSNIQEISMLAELAMLKQHRGKAIKHFSSGMKQRVKLLTALTTDASVLLLDEPLSNLDEEGEAWYLNKLNQFGANRIVIIASNQEREYRICNHQIDITAFKS